MTEGGWLACADPESMLRFLGDRASDRKLRLFCVACCRRAWHLISSQALKDGIDTLERFADGKGRDRDRIEARKTGLQVAQSNGYSTQGSIGWALWGAAVKTITRDSKSLGESAAAAFGYDAARVPGDRSFCAAKNREREQQALLLRDLFGNPFRPTALAPTWLTPDVRALAAALYEDRAFDRLPILADALEEAGCTDATILEHLRGPGPHARGCWALDRVLAKE
jgi:hypothetical protein